MEKFLRHLRARNLRPSTIYMRHRSLIRLRARLDVDLLDVTREDLLADLDALAITPESKASELACWRTFYRWALGEGLVDTDPTALIPRPRVPRHLPRPMPTDTLRDALAHAPDRIRLALILAAYAGLRACEIAQLRGEHCIVAGDAPMIHIETGKGGGSSTVPMHPIVAAELAGWPRRGPVWPVEGHPGRCAIPANVSSVVNGWLHRRGHPETLHQARHWFGTEAYRSSGRDLRATQELLRHRSVVSTQIYTALDPGPLRGAVDGLPMVA